MIPYLIIIGLLTLLVLGFLWRSSYERKTLKISTYEVNSPSIPASFNGKKILFISDLHNSKFGEKNEKLYQTIRDAKADYLFIGGDMIVGSKEQVPDFSNLEDFLKELSPVIPIYYANGNHEDHMRTDPVNYPGYEIFTELLDKYHVIHVAEKDCEFFPGMHLISVYLPHRVYERGKKKTIAANYMETHLGKPMPYQILLLHSPLYMEDAATWGADLCLMGHFHGGTIYIPELGGLMTPQIQFFEKKVRGIFDVEGMKGVITRGLGTHSVNIRINDFPEIVTLLLTHGEDSNGI